MKVIVVNEKLIFTGKKEIVNICKEKYETCFGVWFMDVARFRELDTILKPYGYQLKTAHPFFLPEKSEPSLNRLLKLLSLPLSLS